ncbi:unnamed protein product [Soboliphyme baturini]|uniref:DUF3421 domain-containing protein n=1 Tax=Soboliphyme baturini TaxID=241478 RepID=A0A183IZQ7_9BILA|nr:unnamed protein product [Soboliphyme baturini]
MLAFKTLSLIALAVSCHRPPLSSGDELTTNRQQPVNITEKATKHTWRFAVTDGWLSSEVITAVDQLSAVYLSNSTRALEENATEPPEDQKCHSPHHCHRQYNKTKVKTMSKFAESQPSDNGTHVINLVNASKTCQGEHHRGCNGHAVQSSPDTSRDLSNSSVTDGIQQNASEDNETSGNNTVTLKTGKPVQRSILIGSSNNGTNILFIGKNVPLAYSRVIEFERVVELEVNGYPIGLQAYPVYVLMYRIKT